MRSYTKKQIAAMCSAIMGTWLTVRDMRMPSDAFVRILSEKRADIVLGGFRERIAWHDEHAAEDRATAAHFRAHPGIYGASTPEMVARFEGFALPHDKGAAWYRALLDRVTRDGLPPEVAAFDPTAR